MIYPIYLHALTVNVRKQKTENSLTISRRQRHADGVRKRAKFNEFRFDFSGRQNKTWKLRHHRRRRRRRRRRCCNKRLLQLWCIRCGKMHFNSHCTNIYHDFLSIVFELNRNIKWNLTENSNDQYYKWSRRRRQRQLTEVTLNDFKLNLNIF